MYLVTLQVLLFYGVVFNFYTTTDTQQGLS